MNQQQSRKPRKARVAKGARVVEVDGRAHMRFEIEVLDGDSGDVVCTYTHDHYIDGAATDPDRLAGRIASRARELAVRSENERLDPAAVAAKAQALLSS